MKVRSLEAVMSGEPDQGAAGYKIFQKDKGIKPCLSISRFSALKSGRVSILKDEGFAFWA